MNRYWCSSQRHMGLIKYARAGNFNKIALGHHLDIILESLHNVNHNYLVVGPERSPAEAGSQF